MTEKSELARALTPERIEEMRKAIESVSGQSWQWERRKVDAEGYVYIPQGSYLGDTLINLGDTYEYCAKDCDYVTLACETLPDAIAEIERLREVIKWYGDIAQYEGISLGVAPLNDDRGQRARDALNQQKEKEGE